MKTKKNYISDMREILATDFIFILVQKNQPLDNCVMYLGSDMQRGVCVTVCVSVCPLVTTASAVQVERIAMICGRCSGEAAKKIYKFRKVRYDTIRDAIFNVRSKADMSQLNLLHGTNNQKVQKQKN